MNLIIHHNDDDGRCAAAIAYRELVPGGWNWPSRTIFQEYKHGYTIPEAETDDDLQILKATKVIVVVDIAFDNEVLKYIKYVCSLCEETPKIWWIDHHKSSLNFLDEADDEDAKFIHENIDIMFKVGISGALLTWIVASIPEEHRDEVMSSENREFYELADDRSAVAILNVNGVPRKEVGVPMGLRYIDDWDVWRHTMAETKYFNLGFSTQVNKHPQNEVWDKILYGDMRWLQMTYLKPGELLYNYQEAQNKRNMARAFEVELPIDLWHSVKLLCLNNTGNSFVFGDKINEYPAVCLFYYDGVIDAWRYSLYSAEESDCDVSSIARMYGGGGHEHAAGFTSSVNILRKPPEKKEESSSES